MKILAFKTNLQNEYQKEIITPVIKKIKGVTRWSLDLEDKNKVLKIEGHGLHPEQMQGDVKNAGFECKMMY